MKLIKISINFMNLFDLHDKSICLNTYMNQIEMNHGA